jgi:hypothetical protein
MHYQISVRYRNASHQLRSYLYNGTGVICFIALYPAVVVVLSTFRQSSSLVG